MIGSPLVSVIVPAYQAEATIGAALDSIWAQGHDNLEVIVVNDGSTDRTGEIVREKHPEAIYIEQENAGASAARNAAAGVARGELLAFLDADDRWAPGFLEHLLALMRDYPEAGFAACNAWVRRGPRVRPFCLADGRVVRELTLLDALGGIRPPGPAVLMRAAAFREVGGCDPDVRHGVDIDLFCRLLAAGNRLFYSTACLYLKVEHPDNMTAASYSTHAAGNIAGLRKLDPRREGDCRRTVLTAKQYSRFVTRVIVRASFACWREGKAEEGLRYLEEIRSLPVRSLAGELALAAGRRAWRLYGWIMAPHVVWLRLSRAVRIWGPIGLARQLLARRTKQVSDEEWDALADVART